MSDRQRETDDSTRLEIPGEAGDLDIAVTTPADVASAGRSCLVILILATVILLILCAWIALSSTGGLR